MGLYLIGLGLGDERDISLRGLEAIKKCDKAYLENFTSKLNCSAEALEKTYGKKIILANRKLVEEGMDNILEEGRKKNIALLIMGSVFGATTHVNYLLEGRKKDVDVKIIDNASIFTAIGITGLSLYNFGKVTSIPFDNKNVEAPVTVIKENLRNDVHTLVLLDIKDERLMNIKEALEYLINKGISKEQLVIGCAGLGDDEFQIKAGSIRKLLEFSFTKYPQCIAIPGNKLHFVEEDAVKMWM